MKKVIILGCGALMDSGEGCPGEWSCLKAAGLGEGMFEEESHVVALVKCECPGRAAVKNVKMAIKLSEIKPDAIYMSNCVAKTKPDCPYSTTEEKAALIEKNTGIRVILGTHDYRIDL